MTMGHTLLDSTQLHTQSVCSALALDLNRVWADRQVGLKSSSSVGPKYWHRQWPEEETPFSPCPGGTKKSPIPFSGWLSRGEACSQCSQRAAMELELPGWGSDSQIQKDSYQRSLTSLSDKNPQQQSWMTLPQKLQHWLWADSWAVTIWGQPPPEKLRQLWRFLASVLGRDDVEQWEKRKIKRDLLEMESWGSGKNTEKIIRKWWTSQIETETMKDHFHKSKGVVCF